MMNQKKYLLQLIWCLGCVLLLSGCFFKAADELYALPELPEDYKQLQVKLDEVIRELEAEYAAPVSGSNTNRVQLQDLDGDGKSESTVAYFRVNSTTENPLCIMIFHQQPDGTYQTTYTIRGDGTAIESISFTDLDGDSMKEILVSWQISTRVRTLTVYRLGVSDAIEMVHTTYSDSFTLCDLDRDNQQELFVLQTDDSGENVSRVEYYDLDEAQMVLLATAPISRGSDSAIPTTSTMRTGSLRDNYPAIYVDVNMIDGTATDIFAIRDGTFTNITMDPEMGLSRETIRTYTDVGAQDINGDGILEIPWPIAIPDYEPTSTTFWLIRWRQFDLEGNAYTMQTNYHSLTDGWYLRIPDEWVGQITLTRDDTQSARGERSVVFSHWSGNSLQKPQEFLRIYRLTGSNRSTRAALGGRFILREENELIYAAAFSDSRWDCGLGEDELKQRFSPIRKEWSSQ